MTTTAATTNNNIKRINCICIFFLWSCSSWHTNKMTIIRFFSSSPLPNPHYTRLARVYAVYNSNVFVLFLFFVFLYSPSSLCCVLPTFGCVWLLQMLLMHISSVSVFKFSRIRERSETKTSACPRCMNIRTCEHCELTAYIDEH